MTYKIEKILEKIKSNDKDVLDQSIKIIDEQLREESERGKSVITRVNTLIALSGAVSAVAIFFGKTILDMLGNNLLILIYLAYSSMLLLLIKSIYYSIRALSVAKGYRLTPKMIFDIQEKDPKKSLRYQIGWKIWEYYQMIPVNTQKLFWFNRGQRNLLFSIICFLCLGFLLFINKKISLPVPNAIQYIGGVIFIVFATLFDFIFEKLGLWHFE